MIGILDLQLGNLKSVANAIYELGNDFIIINQASQLDDVTHLIFPGVGHFRTAMQRFNRSGLLDAVKSYTLTGRPLLGICLGMQILASQGYEGGLTSGLGFVPGDIVHFSKENLRVPHIGWNQVHFNLDHPVFENIKQDRDFYFVHSYHYLGSRQHVYAVTEYGEEFPSIIGQKNIMGFQFHPEKSQKNGLQLLENFCQWDGRC